MNSEDLNGNSRKFVQFYFPEAKAELLMYKGMFFAVMVREDCLSEGPTASIAWNRARLEVEKRLEAKRKQEIQKSLLFNT